MGTEGISGSWAGLHRLRASFDGPRTRTEERVLLEEARDLGATAVPLCVRELASATGDRRTWAITLLRALAEPAGERVRAGLRELAGSAAGDDAKLAALGLLAELGDETATAKFADPDRIHQKSLERFATQLDTAADVASAADLLVSRMEPEEIIEFVESFAEASPEGARRLADELCARVDLDVSARSELVRVAAPLRLTCPPPVARPLGRPALLVGLRHHDGRIVVAVARRSPCGEGRPSARRWRFLCVLCDAAGSISDVHYRDDATLDVLREDVVRPLEAAGYERFNVTGAAARRMVSAAARRTVSSGRALPSPYYLGRDLLGITDSHVVGGRAGEPAALLGRAVDLLAAGESARARPLLEHCVATAPDDAEAASSLGLCLLAQGDLAAAVRNLQRAAWLEPAWPLHHWNLAAAAHRVGDLAVCARALRDFLGCADDPSIGTLAGAVDPGHTRRVSLARRFVADHARLEQSASGLGDEPRAPN
ncbi:MAG TPA: hypothetical protein VM261_37005 [Kofleriaceae bacterium]|nr:hypothetical protein [Kofleriaceae bacterium]